jgi:hypothetical protein
MNAMSLVGKGKSSKAHLWWLGLCLASLVATTPGYAQSLPDRAGTQWAPYLEWSLNYPGYSGNPYDVVASATFKHAESGDTHTTGMFYAGGTTWKFRFTGTRTGDWTFTTSSPVPDLDGKSGNVSIAPNSDSAILGFVTQDGNRWARQVDGASETKQFVPQLVMVNGPQGYYGQPEAVDAEIDRFINDHGFNGFHILVACRWADMEKMRCDEVSDRNPDARTFEALELVITKVHAAGGVVHIWAWGDESRRWTPKAWGLNGPDDRRIQRYIAARLGPLPGWTMGYGFDLWEWASESNIKGWHDHMHAQFGWPIMLGARATKNTLDQLYEGMDYSGYEQHQPDYDTYVATIERRPSKPSFSEDRFRIRPQENRSKDYTHEMVRRGLWHSTMAGGVANIWGDLTNGTGANDGVDTSSSFPDPAWIKTNELFFRERFHGTSLRCNDLTDGVCLRRADGSLLLFYKEGATQVTMNLSGLSTEWSAVAVDTKREYADIAIDSSAGPTVVWNAPYTSDWAIAVSAGSGEVIDPPSPPKPPTDVSVD